MVRLVVGGTWALTVLGAVLAVAGVPGAATMAIGCGIPAVAVSLGHLAGRCWPRSNPTTGVSIMPWIKQGQHRCTTPSIAGRVVNAVGWQWRCGSCGRTWEIQRVEGVKRWVELFDPGNADPHRDPHRGAVLDELAARLAGGLDGDELAAWRLNAHAILCALEAMGRAPWAPRGRPGHRASNP
jgi:hypothetical protein